MCFSPPVFPEFHSPDPLPLVFSTGSVLPFSLGFALVPGRDWAQGRSTAVEGFASALHPPILQRVGEKRCQLCSQRWERNVVNSHQSQNPRISILSAKQLEVFEVLFGVYSSELLCQGGIFIIKKNKLAVVHLAELNSKVIVLYMLFSLRALLRPMLELNGITQLTYKAAE